MKKEEPGTIALLREIIHEQRGTIASQRRTIENQQEIIDHLTRSFVRVCELAGIDTSDVRSLLDVTPITH